jgi:penicillin-binding protein 2
MEHAGFGATWAGPTCTVIAEKYITGTVKREHLYKRMISASFMGEYKRQWYKEHGGAPKPDSAHLKKIKDSLKLLKEKNLKKENQLKKNKP